MIQKIALAAVLSWTLASPSFAADSEAKTIKAGEEETVSLSFKPKNVFVGNKAIVSVETDGDSVTIKAIKRGTTSVDILGSGADQKQRFIIEVDN